MKRTLLSVLLALGTAQLANAGEQMDKVQLAANTFANCAGLWDFHADLMESEGKPATAQQMHNMGNGAETAAMWLYASAHSLDGGGATRYGSWKDLVHPKREANKLRLQALVENEEFQVIQAEAATCLEMAEEQESILQLMRADRVREEQAKDDAPPK